MRDIKISGRRAVHEQSNLLGRAGKEIIAKFASMKRVAAAPLHVSRFLAQDAPDRKVDFDVVSDSLLHPRSGDNIDPTLH